MNDPGSQTRWEKAVIRKVFWRIIPLCFALYVVSYIDRTNIGYAALQMNKELALGSEAFGFAAGIFFIGYFLFEVPSNIAMGKFGPRIWMARILVSWGVVAVLTAFVQNATQLYILRFLLGVAEAGYFPGMVIYLTGWFRAKEQAATLAYFTAAIPASFVLGAPLSTFIMDHVHGLGLSGWRWMMLLEGIPALLGGIFVFFRLIDRPDQAKWLSAEEKIWLADELARDQAAVKGARHLNTWQTLTDGKVLYLSLIFFLYQCGSFGVGYWLPQLIKGFSETLTNVEVGLIAMTPYALATVGMVLWSIHSDRKGERQWHSAVPLLVSGLALCTVGVVAGSAALSLGLFSVALTGFYAFKAPFWGMPSLFLTRSTAGISIAVINSVGNLGGFVGPFLFGTLKAHVGVSGGLLTLSALVIVASVMTMAMRVLSKEVAVPMSEATAAVAD